MTARRYRLPFDPVCVYVSSLLYDIMTPKLLSRDAAVLSTDDVITKLETNVEFGLNQIEVEKRQAVFGSNEFDVEPDAPLWKKYLEQVCMYSIQHQVNSCTSIKAVLNFSCFLNRFIYSFISY